jgi:hypothetical protein
MFGWLAGQDGQRLVAICGPLEGEIKAAVDDPAIEDADRACPPLAS